MEESPRKTGLIRVARAAFPARGLKMKLKRTPEDFQVEELPVIRWGDRGRFVLYRLTKRGLGTLEAIEAICRRWNLAGRRVSYGGLKDRHALTTQYLTIVEGPERFLQESSFELEPLGRVDLPYGPAHFRGNRFVVVIRDLDLPAVERARRGLAELPRDGLPNYFDDQRFGSVGFDGGFVARAWLQGQHEEAFRLAVAAPNPSDRPGTKQEKAILREFWGNWAEAKARLDRSHARSLVTYLADHPTDFKGAFSRIRRELRTLYFSAYQSYLWNLILARVIERLTTPEQRSDVDFKVARLPIHHGLNSEQAQVLAATRIPLPASRTALSDEGIEREAALEVVASEGLEWNDLRVKHLKDVFFSKGNRPALFFAENLSSRVEADELHPRRRKLELRFELPKGAYATLLVKRVIEIA
ncbi:MAG: tRNA pseudouridine(13) synthase TruD [Isosphaeraceae bacterium]